MLKWIIISVIAAAGIAGIASTQFGGAGGDVRIPYEDAAAVRQGEVVYRDACASCHGAELEGQPNWRQRLPNGRLPAPPHDATGHTWHHPDQQLFEITKYGTEKFAPPGYESDMIGFGEMLSDDEILAALAYIKASWPENIQVRHNGMTGG